MATAAKQNYTTGEAAVLLGVQPWKVAEVFKRGLLPEPERIGKFRLIGADQLGQIRAALIKAGYLEKKEGD